MDTTNKNILIKICIILLIVILLRFLYIRLYSNSLQTISKHNNTTIENFDINNGDAIDLLSKLKSNSINPIDPKIVGNAVIKPWSTKIYNMQSGNLQMKAVALYQPNLLIKNIQYCKLGDMLCQNNDYSPPSSSHYTLLIKKSSSDYKPPIDYDLIVNFGDESVNTNYYNYESYITSSTMQDSISTVLPNIMYCSNIFATINTFIQNNIITLRTNLTNIISKKIEIIVNNTPYKISNLIKSNNPTTLSVADSANRELNKYSFKLPAGITGFFISNEYDSQTGFNNTNPINIPITIPSSLDSLQSTDKTQIASYVPSTSFVNINSNNISIETYKNNLIINLLPITNIITIIQTLCNNINTIYDSINNPIFLTYLNLVNNIQNVKIILNSITKFNNFISHYNNINNITIYENTELKTYVDTILNVKCGDSSVLGLTLSIFQKFGFDYNLTYVLFNVNNLIYSSNDSRKINVLQLDSFNNNFISNLSPNSLNVNLFSNYSSIINSAVPNITDFTSFINGLKNNTIKNLPLKVYSPVAPEGYVSLGHIFSNLQSQLADIKINDAAGNGTCCVPKHCVKEMRDWNVSDKMFEYNKNGIYWALYYNPYIGTFISTNTNSLPDGKVSKVVACVKKCTAIDELKKADDCIRKYANMSKKHSVKISPDLVSDTEEGYYLDKVRAQSDTITKLYKKANRMQLDIDKASIVNAEMNKNKLQTYVDTQKRNIDIVTQRLVEDANKIETNVNIPLDVLNALLNMIRKSRKLSRKQKSDLIDDLLDNEKLGNADLISKGDYDKNLRKIMSNCPDYDLTGLVKKAVVSDVCYGCPT